MRCGDFQQRWQILLDQRRSPQEDKSLCAHAEICEDCSEILRIQTLLFREINRAKHVDGRRLQPGRAPAAAVAPLNARPARFVGNDSRARQPLVRALFFGLAVAGSLLVVVVPAWRHSTTRDHAARVRPAVVLSGRRSLPPVMWVAKTPPAARRQTGEAAISQPTEMAPTGMAPTRMAPTGIRPEQEVLRKLMQDVAARLSDVPPEQLEPLDRIAGGFRPLANTLGVAWDALRRTIPVGRRQAVQDPQAVLGWPGFQASPA